MIKDARAFRKGDATAWRDLRGGISINLRFCLLATGRRAQLAKRMRSITLPAAGGGRAPDFALFAPQTNLTRSSQEVYVDGAKCEFAPRLRRVAHVCAVLSFQRADRVGFRGLSGRSTVVLVDVGGWI